jgi:hypothetical protein
MTQERINMSSKLYDNIRNMTEQSFEDDGPTPYIKAVTVRPSAYAVCLADHLAEQLCISRAALLEHVFNDGIEDAVHAFIEAHGQNAKDVEATFVEGFAEKWSKMREELNK